MKTKKQYFMRKLYVERMNKQMNLIIQNALIKRSSYTVRVHVGRQEKRDIKRENVKENRVRIFRQNG